MPLVVSTSRERRDQGIEVVERLHVGEGAHEYP